MTEEKWGVYDTETGTWMGNDDGPVIYTDFMMARVAAQMIDVQLGQRPGRTEAREYQEGPKRLRETVKTRMTPEEALAAMESGKVI